MSANELKKKRVRTSFGQVAYLETGDAGRPPLLFVHGIPTSSYLWRDVIRLLQNDYHCLAPDLMGLGDTEVDPRRTPLHMEAQAEMLLELVAACGHDGTFGVVAHDQGGAAAQVIAARTPDRIAGMVLTDCVCFDNWPVPIIARLQAAARYLGPLLELAARAGVFHLVEQRTPLSSFRRGVYRRGRLTDGAIGEYLRPLIESRASRERFVAFLLAGSPRYTERALAGLRRFDRPTLVIWAGDDRYISPSWGARLAEEIPGCRGFELVPFCGHFWPEELPAPFAARIGDFFATEVFAGQAAAVKAASPAGEELSRAG